MITDQEKLLAEIVRLNNQDCERLRMIRSLCTEIDALCHTFCKDPNKIEAYKKARMVL